MRKIKYITLAIGAAICLQFIVGCNRDVNRDITHYEITVDGLIEQVANPANVPTKISAASFSDGDNISFYTVKYVGGVPQILGADGSTYIKNQLYKRDNGVFKSFNGTSFDRQFFPSDGSWVDLYAIYPYNSVDPADYTAYKFAVKTNQSLADQSAYFGSDLMMAKHGGIAPTAIPNKLTFNHLFSRIIVNAKATNFPAMDGGAVVKIESVTFISLKSAATVDLRAYDPVSGVAGAVISVSDVATITPLVATTPTTGYDISVAAIVPVQLLSNSLSVMEITLTNQAKYTFELEADCQLKAGMEALFNITVDFGNQYEIVGSPVTIVPWGTLNFDANASQESDDKFHVELTSKNVAVTSVAKVKIGVVGDSGMRTFELALTANAGAVVNDLYFEFAGVGNRPNGYPFKIATLELLTAGNVTVGSKLEIAPADRIAITSPTLTELVYDMTAKTLTKK